MSYDGVEKLDFEKQVKKQIEAMADDPKMREVSRQWMDRSLAHQYSYNFKWLGVPIIQYPQDILAMQELIWEIQPDLIIEMGIARGGSLIFSASMLELLGGDGNVLGVDVDIRTPNWGNILRHPMSKRITMIEGSSLEKATAEKVYEFAKGKERILVCLDSNHTHDHVLEELKLYAPLTTLGSYCVVFDTIVEDARPANAPDRPWGVGNNPKTAVHAYLKTTEAFEIDNTIEQKLQITVCPDGFLKRIR